MTATPPLTRRLAAISTWALLSAVVATAQQPDPSAPDKNLPEGDAGTRAPGAQDAKKPRKRLSTTSFTAPDGTRFLLAPTEGAPMLYVAAVTPAGELVDPPGYPHLSYAVARASLSGTDTVGTRSWIEERRIDRDIDIYRAEVREYEARGETPPTSTTAALERALRERTILLDESEWLRRVQDAPSIDFTMSELQDAVLVQVTTVPEGFATVCRLLLDRRENARLRSLERDYPRVYERRQSEARTARARLHAEIRDLAFTGLGRRAPRDDTPIPVDRARELYFRTQNPAASYYVITGSFDPEVVRKFLENQFSRTALEPKPAPRATRRSGSRERSSEIEIGNRSGLGIAFELADDIGPVEAEILAEGLAGGEGSLLDQSLRERNFTDLTLLVTTPFPATSPRPFLLVEVWQRDAGAGGARQLETEVFAALDDIFRRGVDVRPVRRAHQRVIFRRAKRERDPAELARWLAIECGIRGVSPEVAVRPGRIAPRLDAFRGGLRMLSRTSRIVVRVEAER